MRFKAKKKYGESMQEGCVFCGAIATQKTDAGLAVCRHHRNEQLEEIKCSCGSYLEQRSGKYGVYFNCLKCGNIPFKKAMALKSLNPVPKKQAHHSIKNRVKEKKREVKVITTDDLEYFS